MIEAQVILAIMGAAKSIIVTGAELLKDTPATEAELEIAEAELKSSQARLKAAIEAAKARIGPG